MIRSSLTLKPWSPTAAAQSGPPHTWIRSWRVDCASLRADVTAAGVIAALRVATIIASGYLYRSRPAAA
jgi:hypothetical protein